MARPNPLRQAADTIARMVYPETDLTAVGEAMRDEWEAAAAAEDEQAVEEAWAEDWPVVLRGFRSTEGALKAFRLSRAEEEESPLEGEGELEEHFRESEDWSLVAFGEHGGFPVRVWAYELWDRQLAFAVARSSEGALASATSMSE